MNTRQKIQIPLIPGQLESLTAGEMIELTGIIYTARDAAHKRMIQQLNENKPLPFDVVGQAIFYVGPSPARPSQIIGACGPTTSSRMDSYAPILLDKGLKMMIGKGPRSSEVVSAVKRNKALYLAGIGGAAALMAQCVRKMEVIDYHDLGTEAIHRLEVVDMPLIVAIDTQGNNLYEIGPNKYRIES